MQPERKFSNILSATPTSDEDSRGSPIWGQQEQNFKIDTQNSIISTRNSDRK